MASDHEILGVSPCASRRGTARKPTALWRGAGTRTALWKARSANGPACAWRRSTAPTAPV